MRPDRVPLVSAVTPVFNGEQFMRETVESALQQTMVSLEVLIADDCSEDGTVREVEALASRDARVRLLRHQRRSGPWAARNTALAAARGRYIAFLDSDDVWLPTKLEEQLRFMRERGAAVSFTRYRRVAENGGVISGLVRIPELLDYRGLLKNTAMMTSTVVVDREMTGPFYMKRTYYDDYACWLELLKRGFAAHGLQRDLMRYRVVRGSVSRNKLRSARHVWEVQRHAEGLPFPYALWCFANYAWNAVKKHHLPQGVDRDGDGVPGGR